MREFLTFTLILFSTIFALDKNIYTDRLLFCLQPHVEKLIIVKDIQGISTNNDFIDQILKQFSIDSIEPWLKGASDNERDGDILLSKIYRIKLKTKSFEIIEHLKDEIEILNDIHSVENEFIRKPTFTPNDSQYGQQWFLPQINANYAWDLWNISGGNTPGDKSILLASVDTGVDWDHIDLRNNIWNNPGEDADGDGVTIIQQGGTWIFDPGDVNYIDDDGNGYVDDFIGWDCSGYEGGTDNNPKPPSGVSNGGTWAHGTHVAGLLSATTNNSTGISSAAFNCSIMSVKVSTGEQSYPYITDGYDGILYAAKAGFYAGDFAIINNSWGGTGYSQYEQATINIAYDDYNAVIIAAGGNGDEDSWGEIEQAHYPSSYDNVISVCPLGYNNIWNHWGTYHETIDIASPGENIRSTKIGTGYTNWDGSSMAAPIVGSVVGLMKSYHPNWSNVQLETMLLGTADKNLYNVNSEAYLQGKLGTGSVDALASITTDLFPFFELASLEIITNTANNQIFPGDQIEVLAILFNNPDWGAAINVSGNISVIEQNSNISILSGTVDFNDAAPGDALLNELEPFLIQFGANSPIGDVEFQLNLSSNQSANISHNQTVNFVLSVSENLIISGDINQDELINVLDIVQLVNFILGVNPTESQFESADINQDNSLNVLDVVNLVNLILDN